MNREDLMVIGSILLAVVLLGIIVWGWSKVSVSESKLFINREEAHFPIVSGYNLMREEFEFPHDFHGKYNLVIIPFQQIQQRDVNTWIPAAQELEGRFDDFLYYELPTIYKLPSISRTFINEGMRAGIPDQTARERTITFYLDKQVFKQALDIVSEESIHLFLVDQEGNILWREIGLFSETKVQSLVKILEDLH
jgi:hypothetical protein